MKQFVIIGLGTFGHFLATNLYKKGHEVLAIDINEELVQAVKDEVSQAVVADATDKDALLSLGVQKVDSAIVCIGSIMEASILCTLNLKDMGVKQILGKATSKTHSRLLHKVGASDVIFPERDQAALLSEQLHNPSIIGTMTLVEGYNIVEFSPLKKFIGKSLKSLDLINKYGVQVLAIKELIPSKTTMIPTGEYIVKDSDLMIMLGPKNAFEKLKK